jgi:hypothetical protein
MAASDSRGAVAKPWSVRARPGMQARLTVAALALACGVAIPLHLSDDVWAYAAYGALLGHGTDPWAHAFHAADLARYADPLLDQALRAWNGSLPRDVYGPVFTFATALVVVATRWCGPAGTIFALRGLASLALLACIALAQRKRPRLARLLALHPVVLWSAAEGHNDAFWLALVLLADHLRSTWVRLAALVAAGAVKAVAVVALAGALVDRRRPVATVLAASALIAAYAPLIWSVLAHGLDRGAGPPRISLLHAGALAGWSGSPLPLALGVALGIAGLAAVARALRAGDLPAGLTLAAWLALPAPEPWYATWLIPVVALAGPTPAARALFAASVTGLAGYVQDAVPGTALRDPALLGGTMLALYALPLIVALFQPAPSPQPIPTPPMPQPSATAAPTPVATTTPVPPSPTPTPQASASPNPFAYVVAPSPGPSGGPQIIEIALNDRVQHMGGMLLVKVTTSSDVTGVVARSMGRQIAIPQGAPGYFAGQEQLPSGIPFFMLNRTYQIEFVATTADGRSTIFALPLRLER